MDTISPQKINEFKQLIYSFYKENKRFLPWRNTTNPYHIYISEVMLQQTQVSRALIKYPSFLSQFPNFSSLSRAPLPLLLHEWNGLGYNRRALYLKKSAQIIEEKWQGILPDDPEFLVMLPGIGKATASSIAVYTYNKPYVFIETNIRRIYIHHFFKDSSSVSDEELIPFIEKTLDTTNPRIWYYALMDYGTYLAKTIVNPNRKSKHYHVQSRFEGSVRQVRGKILRVLLSKNKIGVSELEKDIQASNSQFSLALSQLEKEGFIEIEKQFVLFKDTT